MNTINPEEARVLHESMLERGSRTSYTIIAAGANISDEELFAIVCENADRIAVQIVNANKQEPFDVDVIKGTFADPLSGDNVHGLGWSDEGD